MESDYDFIGSKIALIHQNHLVTILRDDKPSIIHPNMWDLPGGGSEKGENPLECLIREVDEEIGLSIDESIIIWQKHYQSHGQGNSYSYFFVGEITQAQIDQIKFGSEGQTWQMMPFEAFLESDQAVWYLQDRFREFLGETL